MRNRPLLALLTVLVILAAGFTVALTAAASGECRTFHHHSGFVPGSYDYANFYEEGFDPLLNVRTNGENINVPPLAGRNSWDTVQKCHDPTTTTTSSTTSSTTTMPTTTTQPTTTTTTTDPSTTTTTPTTTSSSTIVTTTSSSVVPSTTTSLPSTTTTSIPPVTTTTPELPFTGPPSGLWLAAAVGLLAVGGLLVRRVSDET